MQTEPADIDEELGFNPAQVSLIDESNTGNQRRLKQFVRTPKTAILTATDAAVKPLKT